MNMSYKPLWHTLVERNMRKEDLRIATGFTHKYDYQHEQGREYQYGNAGSYL